jgi:transposase
MAWRKLSDSEWEILGPLLKKQHMGRPRIRGDREIMDALLYVLSTGIRWEELPECFPPKMTVYDRFRIWVKDGTFENLLPRLRRKLPQETLYHLDSTVKSAKKGREDFTSRKNKRQQNNTSGGQQRIAR